MGLTIGIDVGGSTTKIIGINGGQILSPMFIKAIDPITSLFGAFGKYIYDNEINLEEVEQVVLTGVGSAYVDGNLYGLPTKKVDEFLANGLGACYGSNLENLIVVSMGTGTSFVLVNENGIEHTGGLGIGGGTLQGLSQLLLKTNDIHKLSELASQGNIENVNLKIKDICNMALPGLPLEATASLLGKVTSNTSDADIAIGLIYMVLQTIGASAVLSALNTPIKDFVLIGNLTQLPQCKTIFSYMENIYHVKFHIPSHAEYRTAIGAALANINKIV